MRLTALGLTAAALAALLAGSASGASGPSPDGGGSRSITVLHTNDLHGHAVAWTGWEGELAGKQVGGLDRMGARIREIRAAVGEARVLLLDAGDTIGDTLLAAETEGRAIIEIMNALRYDAMVIGNHEPDFTAEKLRERIGEANFPVLAANIRDRHGKLFAKPYVVREIGGVRVGILGIAYPNTPLTSAKRNVAGLVFEDAVTAARRYVARMRRDGAELLTALTHLGLGADKELAEKVPEFDVIVGGHSHNRMKNALRIGKTLIVQAGAHGSGLGRLDLTFHGGRVVAHTRKLIPVIEGSTDAAIGEIAERHQESHRHKSNERIARAATVIAPRADPRRPGAGKARRRISRRRSLCRRDTRNDRDADRFSPGPGLWRCAPARRDHRRGPAQSDSARFGRVDDGDDRRADPRGPRTSHRKFLC